MLNGIIKMIARFIYKWVVYFTVTFINIVSPPISKKEQKTGLREKTSVFVVLKSAKYAKRSYICCKLLKSYSSLSMPILYKRCISSSDIGN